MSRPEEMEMSPIRAVSDRSLSDRRKDFQLEERNFAQLDEELLRELRNKHPFREEPAPQEHLTQANIPTFMTWLAVEREMSGLRVNYEHKLGNGFFGVVYAARFKDPDTGEWMEAAVKTCKLCFNEEEDQSDLQGTRKLLISSVLSELLFWRKCSGHPNICSLFEGIRVREYFWFIAERLHGDMFGLMKTQKNSRFGILQARAFFQDVVAGMNFMHALGVAHRDLKLENVLYYKSPDGTITFKISDFGLCAVTWTTQDGIIWRPNRCGTVIYMPPEILFNKFGHDLITRHQPMLEHETQFTPPPVHREHGMKYMKFYRKYLLNLQNPGQMRKSDDQPRGPTLREYKEPDYTNALNHDTWSLGVMLFVMTHGVYPTIECSLAGVQQTLLNLIKGKIIKFRFIPQALREFIRLMLEPDPAKRATIRDIVSHDWLRHNPPSRDLRRVSLPKSKAHPVPQVPVGGQVPGPETGAVPKGRRREPSAGAAVVEVHPAPRSSSPRASGRKPSLTRDEMMASSASSGSRHTSGSSQLVGAPESRSGFLK